MVAWAGGWGGSSLVQHHGQCLDIRWPVLTRATRRALRVAGAAKSGAAEGALPRERCRGGALTARRGRAVALAAGRAAQPWRMTRVRA